MFSRVVGTGKTTYNQDFRPQTVQRVRFNYKPQLTTGRSYNPTPSALYESEITETTKRCVYTRPRTAKPEITELPSNYSNTVKPGLAPQPQETVYHHYYGRCGQRATDKESVSTPRALSKTNRSDTLGTTKGSHHIPGYQGHIPRQWKGNRGKTSFADRSCGDITWQYQSEKAGFGGYVPSCNMTLTRSRDVLNRTPTTYRDMCDELGFPN